jgi:hypothetical protein
MDIMFKLLGSLFIALIFNFLVLWLFDRSVSMRKYRLDGAKLSIELTADTKNVENVIRELSYVMQKYKNGENSVEIEIIDKGMKNEEREVCEIFAKDYEYIKLKSL